MRVFIEQETSLGKSIRVLDDRAKLDAACKRLLSEKVLLAWIMKSCIEKYKDCEVAEIAEKYIEGTPAIDEWAVHPDETAPARIQSTVQEDTSLHEHTILYDIRFHATVPSTGEPIRLIINVESQNKFRDSYPLLKRAIYYCNRLISSQSGTEFMGARYGEIQKVYGIWLCANPPKGYRNTITHYRMTEENMVGAVQEPTAHYDLLTVVMLCLGGSEDENYSGILKLLGVLLLSEVKYTEEQRILRQEFDLAMTHEMEMEMQNMCNLSEGVWERGMEKAIEKGVGEFIRNLVDSLGFSLEQAMSALKVPESQRSKYKELLQK